MSDSEDYIRGVRDGKTATRLNHHAAQIAATGVTLAQAVATADLMASTLQTLTEARVTDAATRIALAAAVKDTKDMQEDQAHASWSPMAKLATVVGSLVGLFGLVSFFVNGG